MPHFLKFLTTSKSTTNINSPNAKKYKKKKLNKKRSFRKTICAKLTPKQKNTDKKLTPEEYKKKCGCRNPIPSDEQSYQTHDIPELKIPKITKQYSDNYTTCDTIGTGASSVVKKCIRKLDKKEFAVKIVNKSNLRKKELTLLKQELKILRHLKKFNYKYIINLVDSYETSKYLYLVLELGQGGDLFELIAGNNMKEEYRINELQIAYIFAQIVRAVHFCHKHGVVHRDLKPENILFLDEKCTRIKLTDFGLSCVGKCVDMKTRCGSPDFVAPELLENDFGYTSKIDWWSCGVILFMMLSGLFPFHCKETEEIYRRICSTDYKLDGPRWDNVSSEAKDLVSHLLVKDCNSRYGYKDIMMHPFIINLLSQVSIEK